MVILFRFTYNFDCEYIKKDEKKILKNIYLYILKSNIKKKLKKIIKNNIQKNIKKIL